MARRIILNSKKKDESVNLIKVWEFFMGFKYWKIPLFNRIFQVKNTNAGVKIQISRMAPWKLRLPCDSFCARYWALHFKIIYNKLMGLKERKELRFKVHLAHECFCIIPFSTTCIRRHNNRIFPFRDILFNPLEDSRFRVEVINGYVEKSLYLTRMQVHRDNVIGSGHGEHVGYKFGRYGCSGLQSKEREYKFPLVIGNVNRNVICNWTIKYNVIINSCVSRHGISNCENWKKKHDSD